MTTQTENQDFDFTLKPVDEETVQLVSSNGVEAVGSEEAMVDLAFELANGLELPF